MLPPFTCGGSTRSVGRGVSVEAHRTLAQHRCQPERGGIAWQQPTEQLDHAAQDRVRPHLPSGRERWRATRRWWTDDRAATPARRKTMLTTAPMPRRNRYHVARADVTGGETAHKRKGSQL
jgi:hypothetical protein